MDIDKKIEKYRGRYLTWEGVCRLCDLAHDYADTQTKNKIREVLDNLEIKENYCDGNKLDENGLRMAEALNRVRRYKVEQINKLK